MDKIETLNQGRALFRQSEVEKDQDRGSKKWEGSLTRMNVKVAKTMIFVLSLYYLFML